MNSIDVMFDPMKYILLVRVWQREVDYSLYISGLGSGEENPQTLSLRHQSSVCSHSQTFTELGAAVSEKLDTFSYICIHNLRE